MFDFDGTLADSIAWFTRAWNEVADEFRFRRIESDSRESLRGCTSEEILQRLNAPLWKLPALSVRMRALAARDAHEIKLFPGVPEMLEDLRASGIATAIVSTNSEANVRKILGERSVQTIDHFACGATLFGKRHKLRKALRATNVSAVEAIYIGDEIRDVTAAREAGIDFGGVAWGFAERAALKSAGAARMFETVEEIPKLSCL